MKIKQIADFLETIAPLSLQETYDNAGLITGNESWECKGIICSLDATEDVIKEAIEKKCNLVVAHHPIIFNGIKKLNGNSYIEKTIITAIKNDIAIYAIHTNMDNILNGVNGKIAGVLGLVNVSVLSGKKDQLKKLFVFVPLAHAEELRKAIFTAGGGQISDYSECSFNTEGIGTFKAGKNSKPFVGNIDEQHREKEIKIEIIFPSYLENKIISSMKQAHPYEEVAYDVITLNNHQHFIGSGIIGDLPVEMDEIFFLTLIKKTFQTPVIRHTSLLNKPIKKIALCGGAGSFLISKALAASADVYITADIKYHEFFDANNKMMVADIGHFESEQFTIDLLKDHLAQKFPTFAILKTEVKTNPVNYF